MRWFVSKRGSQADVWRSRIHSTTFTCGPRPRAPSPPHPGQGDILPPHRYLGCARLTPFSPQGQDSGSSSYLTEIKDGSRVESALLNKLHALSTKYLGCDPLSWTALFPRDQDPLSLSKVSWMCTAQPFSGLGQEDVLAPALGRANWVLDAFQTCPPPICTKDNSHAKFLPYQQHIHRK